MMTCMQPRPFGACPRRQPSFVPAARMGFQSQSVRHAVAPVQLRPCTAAPRRRAACKAEGGDGGNDLKQQTEKLAEDVSKKAEETAGGGVFVCLA